MQVDSPGQIRNLALAGHGDTGKTTLASALLYTSGVANRLNRVEDGSTTTDFDSEEIERGMSISLSTCFAPWQKHKVNLIDTPGSGIFGVEIRAGIRAADTTLLLINAVGGVEVMTERIWNFSAQINQPTALHLNKMDRENADFSKTLENLRSNLDRAIVPLQIPIGKEENFAGVVDLVTQKAYRFATDGDGKGAEEAIPSDLTEAVEEARNQLMEAIAETDEALLDAYFEAGKLTQEQLTAGLRKAILKRRIFPLTLGAALHGIGSSALLDTVLAYLPSPTDRGTYPATNVGGDEIEQSTAADSPTAALVFKTINDPFSGKITLLRVISGELTSDSVVYNSRAEETEKIGQLQDLQGKVGTPTAKLIAGDIGAIAKLKHSASGDTLCGKDKPVKLGWIEIRPAAVSYAIEPKSKGDEEKISDALHRLMDEDLGLTTSRDARTGEVLLSGSGQLHVEIAVAKLASRYKVEVILHPPKVPYRETIKRAADGHGRHKKQSGGRGQFGDCKIKMEPLTNGEEFEWADEIFGGSIPQSFRPAVEKGIHEARARGYLAGFPVAGFKVSLLDGQYHDVDSSEMAFKVAGSLAFKDAMSRAMPTLLEPIMSVEIRTTDEFMGDIMGDLSQRRGRPLGMDTEGAKQIIKATIPMAEMLDYSQALRSITQGRSRFTMEFSHYDEVPKQIQQKIIAEAQRAKEEH